MGKKVKRRCSRQELADYLADLSQQLRRGKLEVVVANSTLIQELTYQKPTLVAALAQALPDQKIQDLRFRLGAID